MPGQSTFLDIKTEKSVKASRVQIYNILRWPFLGAFSEAYFWRPFCILNLGSL